VKNAEALQTLYQHYKNFPSGERFVLHLWRWKTRSFWLNISNCKKINFTAA